MSDRLKPKLFSAAEGEELQPWQGRHVTRDELHRKWCAKASVYTPHIWIDGLQVHAFVFHDNTVWDAINQWRNKQP